MDAWNLDDVDAARSGAGELYHEFLRVESMSAGLYVLEAGASDPQSPHAQDEIYYVISGRARFTRRAARIAQVGAGRRAVRAGAGASTASTRSRSGSACSSCSPRRRAECVYTRRSV